MPRIALVERSQYVGSIFHSLERLPRWYQVVGVGGVAIAMYLRNTALIQWLVVYLHSSLGTEGIWYPDYKVLLDYMTFNERIGFTLYGVMLALIVLVVCKLCVKDQLSVDRAGSGLIFPSRKIPSVTVYVLMCIAEGFRLHCHIISCLSDPHSVAHSALHSVKSTNAGHFIHYVAGMNTHFVIQFEIFKAYMLSFVWEQIPVFVLACLFRLCRDVPRSAHAEFRWHMATIAHMTLALELFLLSSRRQWNDIGAWSLLAWATVYLIMVNYMYGPQKRSGLLISANSKSAIEETIKRSFICAVLWMIACLVVLTLVVSVHVIELVCIWLSIFMLIVWIPAIIDSGALEYIVFLSGTACYLFHEMGYLTSRGCVYLFALMCVWWFNACLIYNVTVNAFHSRYMGMFVIAMCVVILLMLSPSQRHIYSIHQTGHSLHNTSVDLSHLYHIDDNSRKASSPLTAQTRWPSSEYILQRLENWIQFVRSISESAAISSMQTKSPTNLAAATSLTSSETLPSEKNNFTLSSSSSSSSEMLSESSQSVIHDREYMHHSMPPSANTNVFTTNTTLTFVLFNAQRSISMYALLLRLGLVGMFALLSVNNGIAQFAHTAEIKLRLRRSSIPLITFTVALRKLVRTLVSVFCVIAFLCTWWVSQHYLLPQLLTHLPLLLSKAVSVLVACTVFGGVVDMRESIYDILMRALGVQNPPSRFGRTLRGRRKTMNAQLYEHTTRMTGTSDMDELYNNRSENSMMYMNGNDYNINANTDYNYDDNDDDDDDDAFVDGDNYNNDEDNDDDDEDNMAFMFDDRDGYLDSIIANDINDDVNNNANANAGNTSPFRSESTEKS